MSLGWRQCFSVPRSILWASLLRLKTVLWWWSCFEHQHDVRSGSRCAVAPGYEGLIMQKYCKALLQKFIVRVTAGEWKLIVRR